MEVSQYQVDAFAHSVFEGNPAAVVPLDSWLPDEVMQSIAAENNLAETAFFVPEGEGFRIRWFTPTVEVKLCGHATLASAYVLYEKLGYDKDRVVFESLSGPLAVSREDGLLVLDFPAQPGVVCEPPEALVRGLGVLPAECLASEDYLVVLESERQLVDMVPDQAALMELDLRGVAVTAPGDSKDFVVRFFGPRCGIPEDPVTGSAYTQLAPYWAERLGRNRMAARQISPRGGDVWCELVGERVKIAGSAVLFLEGEIHL